MHLAIVSPYPPAVTGIGQYGFHVSRALSQTDMFGRITLLTGQTSESGAIDDQPGIVVERIWNPDGLDAGLRTARRLVGLKPDLVWFNLGVSAFGRTPLSNLSGFSGPLVGRSLGLATVATLHEVLEQADLQKLRAPGGVLAGAGVKLMTRLAAQADVVCLTLRRHREWLARRYSQTHWVHIPHGTFDKPDRLVESERQELLIFTTYAPFKGLELLLEATRRLKRRYPRLELTVAGAEHTRFPGYLEQVKRSSGDLPGVHWVGCVPEADLRAIFQRAAIVVLPYLATTGTSSVLYRAATWGRSVVASDLPEMQMAARESGMEVNFFRSGEARHLEQVLDELLRDPERRRAQVECNLRAVRRTTLEDTSKAYLQAFNLALSVRQSSKRIAVPAQTSQELP